MEKVYIIYWTQSGNTEAMANAVADGVKAAGKTPVLLTPSAANAADLKDMAGFAMGCPAMGNEELDDSEMEPFVAETEGIVSGKTVALFGSYGWGDGEWMRNWVSRMESAGAKVIGGTDAIALEAPGAAETDACNALGKTLAEL